MAEVEVPGWVAEFIPRHSKDIMVLWKDGEVRGSIELYTQEEKDSWQRMIEWLNDPASQKSTLPRSTDESSLPANAPTTSGNASSENIPI
jgi:hypothetical protein